MTAPGGVSRDGDRVDVVADVLLPGAPEPVGPADAPSPHGRVRRAVLEWIVSDELQAGDRVGVSRFARETGLSRTPVREALLQLQREGLLALEENRGFFVPELTEREARELYPILHSLEDLALASIGRYSRRQLEALEEWNAHLSGTENPEEAVVLNFAWHKALTEPSGNSELQLLLERYRLRVYRYEHTYYQPGPERVAHSVSLHNEIRAALRSGAMDRARAILKRHWLGDYSLYLPGGRTEPQGSGRTAPSSGA